MTNVQDIRNKSDRVNVVLTRRNWEDLRLLGQVPESFNDIINRLLEEKRPVIESIRESRQKEMQLLNVSR
jgi:predicted CopG family antitoxin